MHYVPPATLLAIALAAPEGLFGQDSAKVDLVYTVCMDMRTKRFQAEGHGDKSQTMAHLVCQTASRMGCRDNPSGCENVLRELDAHLKASGSSMLFEASGRGRTDIAKAMIAMGSDPNAAVIAERSRGWTPLLIAAAEGYESTVAALLDAGADPNVKNDLGRTPLMFASTYGFTAIVKVLLARGADPNLAPTDAQGWTALMVAARAGHAETVQALLSGGAGVALIDKSGNTALALAEAQGHSAVARVLREHGRKDVERAGMAAAPSGEEEPAFVGAMKSDLRMLVLAEEVFYADSSRYSSRIGPGGVNFRPREGNKLLSLQLTDDGWAARMGNANIQTVCAIYVGSKPLPPAREEGVPACK